MSDQRKRKMNTLKNYILFAQNQEFYRVNNSINNLNKFIEYKN